MNASVIGQGTFQTKALEIIFNEVKEALAAGYKGVNFEGRRDKIWISYATSASTSIGQAQRYSSDHWQNICLAMRLVGRLAHRYGWPNLVCLREGVGFNCTQWCMYPINMGDNFLSIVYQLLQRVDETIMLLDAHLELPATS